MRSHPPPEQRHPLRPLHTIPRLPHPAGPRTTSRPLPVRIHLTPRRRHLITLRTPHDGAHTTQPYPYFPERHRPRTHRHLPSLAVTQAVRHRPHLQPRHKASRGSLGITAPSRSPAWEEQRKPGACWPSRRAWAVHRTLTWGTSRPRGGTASDGGCPTSTGGTAGTPPSAWCSSC